MSDNNWEQIATCEEIEGQTRLSVIVDDTPALLILLDKTWYVVEDMCTHDGQPLTDGEVTGSEIVCPRHGARFDIKTGAAMCMPATKPIAIFDVEMRNDGVYAQPHVEVKQEKPKAVAIPLTPLETKLEETATSESSAVDSTEVAQSSPNETAMLDALKQVIDPELFVNIVDLGLVYDISRSEEDENAVIATMTLTSPACPAGPQLIAEAKAALEGLPGITNAEIKMTMTPTWTPEMMTEDARDQLGIF